MRTARTDAAMFFRALKWLIIVVLAILIVAAIVQVFIAPPYAASTPRAQLADALLKVDPHRMAESGSAAKAFSQSLVSLSFAHGHFLQDGVCLLRMLQVFQEGIQHAEGFS